MILLYIINDTYHLYISMYMRYDGLWCVQAHPSIFVQPYTFSGQPAVFQAMLAQDRAMIEQLQRKPPRESAVRKKPPTPLKVSQRVVPISEQLRREQILGWRKLAKHLDDIPGVGVLYFGGFFFNRTRTLVFHQQLRTGGGLIQKRWCEKARKCQVVKSATNSWCVFPRWLTKIASVELATWESQEFHPKSPCKASKLETSLLCRDHKTICPAKQYAKNHGLHSKVHDVIMVLIMV